MLIQEKCFHGAAQSLSNAELIALLIQKNDATPAENWLQHYQGLCGFLNADFKSLSQQGVTLETYCQLKACLELQKRYLQEPLERYNPLHHSQDAKAFLIAQLRPYDHEVFACLFLDIQHRLIRFEKLFTGSLKQTHVHPREVVKRALFHNAAAVIIAHNHPSGTVKPSLADREITERLRQALDLIEVRLLDHIIVAQNRTYSMAEAGLLLR